MSEEERDDTYIIPVLKKIYEGTPDDINIILFHNNNGSFTLKKTEYTDTKNICIIYNRGSYYEPFLYRFPKDKKQEEAYILTDDLVSNKQYEKIYRRFVKVIQEDKKTDPDLFETYLKKVKHIHALFIDNYSNVSHIITQANEMLPITPCEIPFNRDYIQVFSSFQISDVKEGMSVEWLKNGKKVSEEQGVADAHPYGARPFKRKNYINKFLTLTENILSKKESDRFLKTVQNLRKLKSGQLNKLNIEVGKSKLKRNLRKGIF